MTRSLHTFTFTLRRWLIGGSTVLVLLSALAFGITQIIKVQEIAQAKAALQGAPTLGVMQVDLTKFAFTPPNIQIASGVTVTWTNHDSTAHNVTFDQDGIISGSLNQGQSFSHTFKTPGTYTYHCTFHQAMLGKITVTP